MSISLKFNDTERVMSLWSINCEEMPERREPSAKKKEVESESSEEKSSTLFSMIQWRIWQEILFFIRQIFRTLHLTW